MTAAVSRAIMALAAHCLGDRRREWACAMQAEFEAAREDGTAMSFALGCLVTAVRQLPSHEEGRLAIAGHALAFLLVIPFAALLLTNVLTGFPHSYLGQGLQGSTAQPSVLNEANLAALPSLALLMLLLAGAHLRLAWLVVERDWSRVVATAVMMAALTVTLTLLAGVAFDHYASAPIHAAALTLELAATAALARRHVRLSCRTARKSLD